MVKHVIIWKLKETVQGADKEKVLAEMKEHLEALVGKVPGLMCLEIITKPLASSNGDVMLDSELESEEALKAIGVAYQALKLPMAYSGRFVAENEGVNGVCKVLVAEDGKVLGASMLGNPASELIVIAGMAIEDGKKLEDWKRYVFPHPTAGEIFREF
jgi:hypothetical protein